MPISEQQKLWARLLRSIWLFPLLLTIALFVVTGLKISGSSIGVYHYFFYGENSRDPNLLIGQPRPIRSDEWLVNTQAAVAQSNDNYREVNTNLGHGENVSISTDIPYKDWSSIFRPQNFSFFVLPFDYAFAFKWWLLAYLLILSCYFFVLAILPKKILFATGLSLALLFSPFIQWWYQYSTLSSIYYCLMLLTLFIYLLRARSFKRKILISGVMVYLLTCFILVLYPPFQIACALASLAFAIGYCLDSSGKQKSGETLRNLGLIASVIIVAGFISLAFMFTRRDAVKAIENTAYPGQRLVDSGGYDFAHLFSGHLDHQLLFDSKAQAYQLPAQGITNQSEDSNFVLFLPFLLIPSAYLFYRNRRLSGKADWTLVLLNLAFLAFVVWLFIPHLTPISKISLLDRVPQNRLIIGFGLLNILAFVIFVYSWGKAKIKPSILTLALYATLIFAVEFALAVHAKNAFPGYIGIYRAFAFSIPVPVIIYLILSNRFELAALGFMVFSIFMGASVNPLYRGTDIITNAAISQSIKSISHNHQGYWAIEDSFLQNFAYLNGAKSLTGVYLYPQLEIWSQIKGADPYTYNRYAHVNFTFYRDNGLSPTKIILTGGDNFGVDTEPCSTFLRNNDVRFIVADLPLSASSKCIQFLRTVHYPARSFYIYHVN